MAVERFGPYRLEELIGRGGMGEVYCAYDTVKDREVAIKRLPSQLAADAQFRARFRRECTVAARLTDPHIVPIHDYGEINGQLFIDMRLIRGVDLTALIGAHSPLELARAVDLVGQAAGALASAHAAGLVHRDVKPSNMLVSGAEHGEDFVHLVDFGIARTNTATSLTATGATVGTLEYMAPERLTKGTCDHRADIYSLGCVLYQTLTGKPPFPTNDPVALMYAHVHAPPPTPSSTRPDVPPDLDRVVATAMAKDPDRRYPTALDLARAARAALPSAPPAKPRTRPLMVPPAAHPGRPPGSLPVRGTPPTSPTRPGRRRKRRGFLILSGIIAVLGVGVVVGIGLSPPTPSVAPTPSGPPQGTAIPVTRLATNVVVTADAKTAYVPVTSAGNSGIDVVDTASRAVTRTIPLSHYVNSIALTPDGRHAYLVFPNFGLVVLDTATGLVTPIPVEGVPVAVAVSPNGRFVAVTGIGLLGPYGNGVAWIDTATNTVTSAIPLPSTPGTVAIAPDSAHLYVAVADSVVVIDVAAEKQSGYVALDAEARHFAITPEGKRLFVVKASPPDARGSVDVIDTASNQITDTVSVDSLAHGVATTPDGRYAYVTTGNALTRIDTDTDTASKATKLNPTCLADQVAVSPDDKRIYISCGYPANILVLDVGAV